MSRRAPGRPTRQILSGSQLAPPRDPVAQPEPGPPSSSFAFRYLVALSVLIVLAALVGVIWGPGAASVILLLVAVGFIASWLVV